MKEVKSKEDASTILLPERLDSATSSSVQRMIVDGLERGTRMIIDGHAVDYMSAAGVRMLATVLHRAEDLEAHLVFCRFTGAAADCLLVSGFGQLFNIAASTEEAQDRLKTKQAQPPAGSLHARQTTG